MSDTHQSGDQGQRTSTLSGRIQNRLNLLSASMRRLRTVHCLLLAVLTVTVGLLLTGMIDFFWPLAPLMRAAMVFGLIVAGIAMLVHNQWSIRDIGPFDAALKVEESHPALGQRLRTAWQFRAKEMTAAASPKLVDALIDDTNVRVEPLRFEGIVSRARLLPLAAGFCALALLVLGILFWVPETRTTLARLTLYPIHYSRIGFEPPRAPVTAGSEITFEAEITGRPLPNADLWVRPLNSAEPWTPVAMKPADETSDPDPALHGKLTAKLDDCQHDMEFKIAGGPVVTPTYQLKVLQPLEQESFTAAVRPPAYTGLEPTTTDETALTVPEGSQVQLQLMLSRIPETAKIVSANGDQPEDQAVLQIDGRQLVCRFGRLAASQQFEIMAETADGMTFTSARIRLRVDKDHKPVVRFNHPEEQIEATPTTEVALAIDVSDDYGLGKVGIEYQIGNGTKRLLWEQDLQGENAALQTIPVLFLEKHKLSFDDAITYYAFAEDNHEQPRRASSELRFIDIRPYKREFEIVDSKCSGGGGSCLSLEELIARQRQNLRRTFANVENPAVGDDLAKRLATTQQEIKTATAEFTAGWEQKFGPVPSLHEAIVSMENAAAELQQKQLANGLLHEQSALEGMVSARKNIRKFIKNCDGGGLSQCRKYDNQMMQKLRAPEKKPGDQKQEVTPKSIQPQLTELAQKQREWSEELKMQSSGGVQLKKKNSPSQPQNGQPPQPKSKQQMAQSQQACSSSAQKMQQAMRQDDKSSELSQQRMDEIAQQIEKSLDALQDGKTSEAAQQAERAADMAEQLNEHLSGLHAADISERLGVAEQIARRVASGEQGISRQLSGSEDGDSQQRDKMADVQNQLADQAATLGDLLKYLEADASLDHPEMQQGLRDLQEMHPLRELAGDMHDSADEIRQGQFDQAKNGTEDASRELNAVARGLAGIRRQFLQPRLDELMAAEAKAAGMLSGMKSIGTPATQAKVAAQMGELRKMLRALNVSTSPSQTGGSANRQPANATANEESLSSPGTPQWAQVSLTEEAELRQIIQVLQQKIQDAILLAARMDADEPVPPAYRRMVEEYYQTLSDDLR